MGIHPETQIKSICESPQLRLSKIRSLIPAKYHDRIVLQQDRGITNLIVRAPEQTKKIVLTAHYDIIGGSYGYNDNASGCVVLLQLIETFDSVDNLEFVFTDQEESGYRGARLYVESLKEGNKEVIFNVNLDIVAVPDSIYYKLYNGDRFKIPETKKAYQLQHLPFNDSLAFDQAGIPSVIIMSGPAPKDPEYPDSGFVASIWEYQHCGPRDTEDSLKHLSMKQILDVCKFTYRFIELNK